MLNFKSLPIIFIFLCLNLFAQDVNDILLNELKKEAESGLKNQKISKEVVGEKSLKPLNSLDQRNEQQKSKVFGIDIINTQPVSITAFADLPLPSDYKISLQDSLQIIISGTRNEIYDLKVGMDGSILIPEIGNIQIAGKTISEADSALRSLINSKIVGADITFSLKELSAKKITIIGAVKTPGTYLVNPFTTISGALAYAGGLEEYASLREIELVKSNKSTITFDLYDLLIFGDRSSDEMLDSGDTVVIKGSDRQFSLEGSVIRPMIYEYHPQDSFAKIITFGLGANREADLSQSYFETISENKFISENVENLAKIGQQKLVKVYVPARSMNSLLGPRVFGSAVSEKHFTSGKFKNLEDIIKTLTFSDDIYPFYFLVKQSDKSGLKKTNNSFSLSDPETYKNFELKSNVEIHFFSKKELDESQIYFSDLNNRQSDNKLEAKEKNKNSNSVDGLSELLRKVGQIEDEVAKIQLDLEPQNLTNEEDIVIKKIEPELLKLIEMIKVQDVKTITFGGDRLFMPLVGRLSGAGIVDYFNPNKNLNQNLFSYTDQEKTYFLDLNNSIQSDDIVLMNFPEMNNTTFEVEITGQVMNPGTYIVSNSTTLDALYSMAGGFTSRAAKNAILFSRDEIKKREEKAVKQARELILDALISQTGNPLSTSSASASDMQGLISLIELSEDIEFGGRLTGDLSPGSLNSLNTYLEPNDKVAIPAILNTVSIIGEVLQPTTTFMRDDFTYSDYLDVAGNLTKFADKRNIYVIRANGTSIPIDSGYFRKGIYPEPGDTLVVPRDLEKLSPIPLVSVATRVISDVAFAAASLNSIQN